jgi:hydroxymethylpyrimidine pyrophosphatase-like HAD family hydrolase
MSIKMIVTDLDGTLLRVDKIVSDYTKSVIRRLRERNILLAFATSRPVRATAGFRVTIAHDIDITSGGSVAAMGGKTMFRAAIDSATANAIFAI